MLKIRLHSRFCTGIVSICMLRKKPLSRKTQKDDWNSTGQRFGQRLVHDMVRASLDDDRILPQTSGNSPGSVCPRTLTQSHTLNWLPAPFKRDGVVRDIRPTGWATNSDGHKRAVSIMQCK